MAELVTVAVRYFAKARELAGTDAENLELPARTDTSAIARALAAAHPALEPLLTHSRISVRLAFARGAVELSTGDEVAVIPPVSGG
jgi:molybdopterin converting factor subunit 1